MVAVLREADRTSVAETAKKHKVSEQTIVSGWRPHLEVGRLANDDGVHLTSEVDTYALQGRDAPAPWR